METADNHPDAPAELPQESAGELQAAVPSTDPDEQSATEQEIAADLEPPSAGPGRGGIWTIPLLCAGIALLACCLLIPQANENHRLLYEREKLKQDLDHLQRQVAVNDEFLQKVQEDPTLIERLAQRQMNVVRAGSRVADLNGHASNQPRSPFVLVNVPSPPPLPAYHPTGGRFASLCRSPRSRLYLIGGGLLMVAAGLILGATPQNQ